MTTFAPALRFSPCPSRYDSWVARRVASRVQLGLAEIARQPSVAGIVLVPVDERGVFSPVEDGPAVCGTTPRLAGPTIATTDFAAYGSDTFLALAVEAADNRTVDDDPCPGCGAVSTTRWSLAAVWQFIGRRTLREPDYLRLAFGNGHHAYRSWDAHLPEIEAVQCGGSLDIAPPGFHGSVMLRRAAVPVDVQWGTQSFRDLPPLQQMAVAYREFEAIFAARASVA